MKRTLIQIIVFFVLSLQLNAQINLVPNYSFEQYDTCPNGLSYLTPSCDNWFDPCALMSPEPPQPFSINGWGSSDYYNTCSFDIHSSIPYNSVGFQNTVSGNAYCGFFFFANRTNYINAKEYIEVELLKSLEKGIEYCLEFNYSIARYDVNYNYEVFQISGLLTDTLQTRHTIPNSLFPANIYATPQVKKHLPVVEDTVNWIKVSGSFIANGGERWLTIGNFQNTDTINTMNVYVYVYIDDVKLWYCGPDTTNQMTDSLIIPNVFTPNGDGINDKFIYKNQEQWEFETRVFNRWEVPVFDNHSSKNWDGTFEGTKVSSGVYFYTVRAVAIKTGEIRIFKGTVTVMY